MGELREPCVRISDLQSIQLYVFRLPIISKRLASNPLETKKNGLEKGGKLFDGAVQEPSLMKPKDFSRTIYL